MTETLPLDVSLFHSNISVFSMTTCEMVNAQLRGRVPSTGARTVLVGANWRLITVYSANTMQEDKLQEKYRMLARNETFCM